MPRTRTRPFEGADLQAEPGLRTPQGFVFAFGFTGGAHDEVVRARSEWLEIELVSIQTLLDYPPDELEPAPDFSAMLRDLYREAERAKAQAAPRTPRPRDLTIEELAASAMEAR